jgi:Na+-transporting methylmalonyl-CoA/oxaloacetate decarboxylase gamma subunit
MSSPFSIAVTALLLGMGVVFVALSLVVALGRLLIRITNRYADANLPPAEPDLLSDPPAAPADPVVAVLTAAVAAATHGRGRLLTATSIDKKP